MNYPEPYRNCLQTQRRLMQLIMDAKTEPRDVASCARALDIILERKRILLRKPLVKAVSIQEIAQSRRQIEDSRPLVEIEPEPVAAQEDPAASPASPPASPAA